MKQISSILLIFAGLLLSAFPLKAQTPMTARWYEEKIRGERFKPYSSFEGSPFFQKEWRYGSITLANGEKLDSLMLKFSTFKDELLYYNPYLSAQIQIDKTTLAGFSMEDAEGGAFRFRKQNTNYSFNPARFFQVLHQGNTDLICHRKVNLISCSPYYMESGTRVNQIYAKSYNFYFYSPQKGYCAIRPTRSSLYAQFTKQQKKEIRKQLRKENISISGEQNFIRAWASLDKAGFVPQFKQMKPNEKE